MTLHCTWRDMMREAAQRLSAAGLKAAPREARLLLAHALGVEPGEVIMRETDSIDPAMLTDFEALIQRRLAGEPVSRIRGWREFYGRKFRITPDVLDPRPETELLVSEGLARLSRQGRVLDLGVGSGCILVSILAERAEASGVGVDISPAALSVARENALALGVAERAVFIEGGWDGVLDRFDLVLSNPPYVTRAEHERLSPSVRDFDPYTALVGGEDGLDPYRAILGRIDTILAPGGWIGLEFGASQGAAVSDFMRNSGLTEVVVLKDLAGRNRAAFGRRPPDPL